MARDFYKPAIWLMWLALPTTALNYWRAWDRLPTRMAVHFDASWQPNGYSSREGSLLLGLGIMALLLLLFTISGFILHAMRPTAAWPMLALFYVVIGIVGYANHSVVRFNLATHSPPVSMNVR